MAHTTRVVAESVPAGAGPPERWFAQDVGRVIAAMGSDSEHGLNRAEAATRLAGYGPNEIVGERPPSVWAVALQQLRDPMNLMLVAVVVVTPARARSVG
ncbi:cation-transporting P-type ATPase [Actinomycetospora cinnamomea]|uniref:Cation transport ATPase-like protein n=1 Tax=Actinomycetospora cinnamomea TaxID=663609 RepID=A0A2U1EDE9_9PSEU|nr:cation-transporting P-type ATPase [Actinomycetospora cinnamomea]PVY97986.1 cation transport ATPase-like protein [Actinomycetospora cinnamomea]